MAAAMTPDDPRHGTANGYTNLGCRCQDCRHAHAFKTVLARDKRRRRIAGAGVDDPRQKASPEHGRTETYHNWVCRCDDCRAANTAEIRERRARKAGR